MEKNISIRRPGGEDVSSRFKCSLPWLRSTSSDLYSLCSGRTLCAGWGKFFSFSVKYKLLHIIRSLKITFLATSMHLRVNLGVCVATRCKAACTPVQSRNILISNEWYYFHFPYRRLYWRWKGQQFLLEGEESMFLRRKPPLHVQLL